MAVILRAVDEGAEHLDAPILAGGKDGNDDPAVIAQRYKLLGRIGQGATGTVYRAFDRTLDRQVAIKLLHPGELEVAEREAQVLAKVTHRNIVTIHDYGQSSGHRYLVLELLEGRDFRSWLRERPTASEIIENFIEAGRGLSAAHRAGLVHRDFKPSNVILTHGGRVVVIDFGLARNLDSLAGELEPQRFAEGTLAYMAPERLAGHENDERSDQFGFCVALWEALAGTNPFVGEDPLARYRSIRNGPARVKLGVPKPIAAGLERGMAFEPQQRFSTMDELLRELDQPVVTPSQRRRRRRRRPALTAIAIVGTFLIGWGSTPDSPLVDEAHSTLDPTAAAAMAILDTAEQRAAAGEIAAINDLVYAAGLIETTGVGGDDFCAFGRAVPEIAEAFIEHDAGAQARLAYAIAIQFSKHCTELDEEELRFHQQRAHGMEWVKDRKPQ